MTGRFLASCVMTRRLVLVSLAVGALTAPAPASSAATGHALTSSAPSGLASAAAATPVTTELAIREILVRPGDPVVGPANSVRLVIDVIARGVEGKEGVTVKVEPGAPAQPADDPAAGTAQEGTPPTPEPAVSTLPAEDGPGDPALVRPEPAASIPVQHVPSQPVTLPAIGRAPSSHAAAPAAGPAAVKAVTARPVKARKPGNPGGKAAGGPLGRKTGRTPSNMEWPLSRWPARPGQAGHAQGRQGEMGPAAWPDRATRLAVAQPRGRTEGWETWRFLPDKALNRFYPPGTWTITATARNAAGASVTRTTTFQLRRETRLTSVRLGESQSAAQVRLSGVLTRVGARGHTDYTTFAEQPLEILWRAASSGTWQKVATARTGEDGAFTRTVRARPGGQWRVRFPGTEVHAPVLSRVFDMGGHRD